MPAQVRVNLGGEEAASYKNMFTLQIQSWEKILTLGLDFLDTAIMGTHSMRRPSQACVQQNSHAGIVQEIEAGELLFQEDDFQRF